MIVLQILGIAAAMVVALFYFGYGLTRLMLPASLARWRVLFTPFAGMALIIVWDYIALFVNLDLTRATWLLLGAVTLLNGYVLARRWRMRGNSVAADTAARNDTRALWVVFAFALIAFLTSVAPLVRYGYATVIGENWDYEFYLPLADYLRALPTTAFVTAPPNPLLTTILSRHILPLPMGFSYLHATLDVLTQQQALDSFAILLGVLRALSVVAAFLFFRVTFRMSVRAALVTAGLVALNGLLLWFTYWSFGLHLAALALAPVALLSAIHALTQRAQERAENVRAILCGGFFLGALNVTYHPALVAVALPLLAIGSYQLVVYKNRLETILRGTALIMLAVVFSFPALFHIQDFIREYYGRAPLAIGLREFVPLSDGYGLSLYLLDLAVGHTIPTPWLYDTLARVWNFASPLLTLATIVSSLYALWRLRTDTERRAVWYLVVAASVFYIALFRVPFLRPYPYGFLKSLSLVAYVLLALAVQGAEYLLTNFAARKRMTRAVRDVAIVAGAAFVLLTLVTFGLSVEQYFKPRPAFFDADALKLRALSMQLPRDATIFLDDNTQVQEIPMGLAAYALQHYPLFGNVKTGYGELNNVAASRVYDYALLARGTDAAARGYQTQAVWANETFALYPRAQGVVAHRALNAQVTAPQTLTLTLGAQEIISGTKNISTTQGVRDVTIAFASFVPQRVELRMGETTQHIALSPGVTTYTFANVPLPATLTLTSSVDADLLAAAQPTIPHQLPAADPALFVPYVQLAQTGAAQNASTPNASLFVRCTNQNAQELDARCFVVNPNRETLTWRWIVRGTRAGTREDQVMAQAETTAAPRTQIDISARLNGGMYFVSDNDAPQAVSTPPLPDGRYRGDLEILRAGILVARIPLYAFEVKQNGTTITRDTRTSSPVILAP